MNKNLKLLNHCLFHEKDNFIRTALKTSIYFHLLEISSNCHLVFNSKCHTK